MAIDTEFTTSLLDNLKLDDLWLPPSSWESIHSESGPPQSSSSSSSPSLNHISSLSEASLVRLAMNALQGVESSLLSIKKVSAAFCSDPADRTFHRIPSLWSRCSSTHAQAKILNSIGYFGFMVLLIRKFVEYFTNPNVDDISMGMRQHKYSEVGQSQNHNDDDIREEDRPPYSLTNHAYAVVVGKVIEGYICSLDTLYASIHLRRSSEIVDKPMQASPEAGCLTSVVYSEITLLELYLHTKELRTHIEALGNICNLQNIAICFSESSFECLIAKALFEFQIFCRGGDLLTYLYTQLQVADPSHCALLKFIFLRSCEPYCRFIRSWIFKADINDPYKEFIIEYLENPPPDQPGRAGISADFHLATIRERDGVAIPCFLKDFVTPLKRVGQQLQVLVKLLELCTYVASGDDNYENCLPCWSGFSGNIQSNSFSMTFSKEDIEAMVILRDSYYKKMKEKLENLLTKLEFGHHQVVSHDRLLNVFGNSGRISNATVYFKSDDCLIGHSREDKKELNVVCDVDSDNSSTTDDLLYEINTFGSSECSSNNTEEQIESQPLIELPSHILLEQKYLSALSFSMNRTFDESLERHLEGEESCPIKGYPCDTSEKRGAACNKVQSHQNEMILSQTLMNLESQESNWLGMTHKEYTDNIPSDNQSLSKSIFVVDDIYNNDSRSYPLGQPKSSHPLYSKPKVGQMRDLEDGFSDYSKVIMTKNVFLEVLSKDQSKNNIHPSAVSTLQEWKFNPSTNFLSKNPMLLRNAFHREPTDTEDRGCFDCRQNFPYFDLSSVRDPSKVFMEKFSACHMVSGGSAAGTKSASYDKQFHDQDNLLDGNSRRFDANASSISDLGHNQEDAVLMLACGGSSWESVLGRSNDNVFNSAEDQGHSSLGKFEMPLEFIIDKCLLQEIMLQYDYVSKLTIKLLEEGFDLQEHLLALRRYHFMESADWADLFILSLWNNKWCITEADQRLPEIQGILESSVQRSSCEYDQNKDRLYVYMKGHLAMPLSISATGVHSFNFIGLGYRVDWPVSIVLTPKALKVYAEIFSFLLQMKLSIFSLTDIWCSLKELRYLIRKNHQNELQEQEVGHFYLLVKLRHQVNHFVSTLQQYVESQLSHVSWCRFLDSLQHKVKDMMDFESVHMAYLLDSLRICFLSDETHIIASIIGSILQCALDFRTSLIGGIFNVGTSRDMSGRLSRINISQVLAIKQTFDKNLHELHLCYLKSPKHAEFGLSKFWGYLNYNEYYSNVGNEIGYYAFSI